MTKLIPLKSTPSLMIQDSEAHRRTRAWVERYPLGEVAALARYERNRPRVPQPPAPRRVFLWGQS